MIALTRSGFVGIAWILRGETMGASHIDTGILLAVIPLVIIDLAMVVYCIVDLFKPDRKVRGNNKLV